MPAVSKSHEDAQRRIWREEIKTLEAGRRKVNKDFDTEARAVSKEVTSAQKALTAAQKKAVRFQNRMEKVKTRTLSEIETRIAILRGRINA